MKADFFILQICDFLGDLGDEYYLWHEPMRQLSRLPGVVTVDIHLYHRFLPQLVEAADVLIFPYHRNRDLYPIVVRRRQMGKATIFLASDYIYDMQTWNPFGAICLDRSVQEEYAHYMRFCDAVQTPTHTLAQKWAPWARRVAVFPNQLGEIPPLPPPRSGPLTIGWGGTRSHFADWYALAPILEKWLESHPDVHLAVMAHESARGFIHLPSSRYHFTHFGTLPAYLKFLEGIDIGLAPLLPTDFNRCRSDVKYIEYASRGVVGVYADLEPYRQAVVHGETGFLYTSHEELIKYLDLLVQDSALRLRLREQAYRYVCENRRLEQHVAKRLEFYRGLLASPPGGFSFPDEIVSAAVRDGNYLQLRLGEPERAFMEADRPPTTRESAQKMARLVAQHPNYLMAVQRCGGMYNELRDFDLATAYLESALRLNPRNAVTLCELALAHYGKGEVEKARKLLEEALEINPFLYPAWVYLLRLLGRHKAPNGPSWARRACAIYPRCYELALLGAMTHEGSTAVRELHQVLETYAPTLTPDEHPRAAAAFSRTIAQVVGPFMDRPEVVCLLRRACEIFPSSARLRDMLGYALRLAGRHEESHEVYSRALAIHRIASAYRKEIKKEEEALPMWQIGEYIRRWAEFG